MRILVTYEIRILNADLAASAAADEACTEPEDYSPTEAVLACLQCGLRPEDCGFEIISIREA